MKLEERAMLVRLSMSAWSASITDKSVSNEVIESKKALSGSGKFRKNLINKDALKSIHKIQSGARTTHNTLTLPWKDDGTRIITTDTYDHYAKSMRTYRKRLFEAVEEFIESYEDHVKAAEEHLGELFNKDDYPSVDKIRSYYDFDVETSSVPTAYDFRAKVSNKEAAIIAKDIERRANVRLEEAMKDVWQRIANVTERMADKLEMYQPRNGLHDSQNNFHSTLVENVRDLADLLPSLNINNDPKLDKMQKQIINNLCQYDADELKSDDAARRKTAKKAKAIYDKVSQYIA